ncbi:MAG: hypothetical protein ACW99U_04100 [Candidatus Thorarchaeota archaeon]
MSSDDKGEKYWLGVRDALRMVDSFLKWSKTNPEHAKSLDTFISEGLIAAAKRCEECLSKDLGLTFKEKEDGSVEMAVIDDTSEDPAAEESAPDFTSVEPSMHFEIEEAEEDASDEATVPIESSDLDTSEPLAPERFEGSSSTIEATDADIEGSPTTSSTRDFGSEFSIDEPTALVIDSEESPESTSENGSETGAPSDDSGITWREYEDIVTETTPESTEHKDETVDHIPDEGVPVPPPVESEEGPIIDEPIPKDHPARWSPYDEPSIEPEEMEIEEEIEADSVDSDDATLESDIAADEETPPPPPPPPETDETEEERRRRARRLFFGT